MSTPQPGYKATADIDDTKRASAHQIGAFDTIDYSEPDAVKKVLEITGGGAAATIDFVGRPETSRFGVDCLRKGGRQIQVGLFGEKAGIPLPFFPLKMISMIGSYVGSLEEMHELMELVKAGKVPPIPVQTRPLEDVNSALDDLTAGEILGRVVVKP